MMILYKLQGYNPQTNVYTNPQTGQVQDLPNTPFVINDSPPSGYELFDTPENWANYGSQLVGSVTGLQEYLSLRREIYTRIEAICGLDYMQWDLLSSEQKQVALVWSNIRIANARGFTFYATECGGASIAQNYISAFLSNSYQARKLRYYTAFTIFGYTYLGKTQGLKAESYAREDFLDTTYVDRGVVFKADDGIDGLGDWIQGINGYSTTGLKPRIDSGEFVLGGGMTSAVFCDTLVEIINDGNF
jgi:hypothetical protein